MLKCRTAMRCTLFSFACLAAGCGGFGRAVYSAVRIENVSVEMPLTNGQPARIVFDIAWDTSFRDDLNRDAVWVFAKFRVAGQAWRHARMATASSAHSIGANNGVLATLEPSSDGLGLFLYRAEDGFTSIDWDQVSLSWDLSAGVATGRTTRRRTIVCGRTEVPHESPAATHVERVEAVVVLWNHPDVEHELVRIGCGPGRNTNGDHLACYHRRGHRGIAIAPHDVGTGNGWERTGRIVVT